MSIRLAIALLIAFVAMPAHAQALPDQSNVMTGKDTTVLPVWNNKSGKVEALLLLQPASQPNGTSLFGAGARFDTGHGTLQAGMSFDNSNSMALLCNAKNGLSTLDSLIGRCLLTSLDTPSTNAQQLDPFSRQNNAGESQSVRAEARFERPESLFELSAGRADFNTSNINWLSPTSGMLPGLGILGGHFTQQDITARGQMSLGDSGWVSIGGTIARARLIPALGQGNSADAQHWNTTSLGVAVGRGKLSGEVIGRVVEVPGQSSSLNSLGIGLSWETPWRGKLTLGAEKSTGANSLLPAAKPAQQDEGTVPYVKYHQDL
ncbi:MAG: hypothetical protein ABIT64_05275 [Lysobacteraceae bacterium]